MFLRGKKGKLIFILMSGCVEMKFLYTKNVALLMLISI